MVLWDFQNLLTEKLVSVTVMYGSANISGHTTPAVNAMGCVLFIDKNDGQPKSGCHLGDCQEIF